MKKITNKNLKSGLVVILSLLVMAVSGCSSSSSPTTTSFNGDIIFTVPGNIMVGNTITPSTSLGGTGRVNGLLADLAAEDVSTYQIRFVDNTFAFSSIQGGRYTFRLFAGPVPFFEQQVLLAEGIQTTLSTVASTQLVGTENVRALAFPSAANVSSSNIEIQYTLPRNETVTMNVYNTTGTELFSTTFLPGAAGGLRGLNRVQSTYAQLGSTTSGLYFLVLFRDNGNTVTSFIVN